MCASTLSNDNAANYDRMEDVRISEGRTRLDSRRPTRPSISSQPCGWNTPFPRPWLSNNGQKPLTLAEGTFHIPLGNNENVRPVNHVRSFLEGKNKTGVPPVTGTSGHKHFRKPSIPSDVTLIPYSIVYSGDILPQCSFYAHWTQLPKPDKSTIRDRGFV